MINANEIREQLVAYVNEQTSFANFQTWLVDRSWDMHLDSEDDAQQLVHDLNESIFDYLDGYIDEVALKTQLTPYVQRYSAHIRFATDRVSETDVVEIVQTPQFRQSTTQSETQRRTVGFGR